MSRVLLGVETLVITGPVFALAQLLSVLFVLWMVAVAGSMFFEPSQEKARIASVIAVGAIGSLVYLYNLAALSVDYVFNGRAAFARLNPWRRAIAFAGPLFSLAWALEATYGSRIGDPVSATAILFLPGVLLLPPALHLICAMLIADYHAGRSRAALRRGGLWPR